MRAAGANSFQVFVWAVLPQVRVAFTGIAIYTWDVAFRAATVVGFFGGGGMGWYLKRNIQQLENYRVGAIILSIIALVLVRAEEHTSELQSLMRISNAVFCLKKTT